MGSKLNCSSSAEEAFFSVNKFTTIIVWHSEHLVDALQEHIGENTVLFFLKLPVGARENSNGGAPKESGRGPGSVDHAIGKVVGVDDIHICDQGFTQVRCNAEGTAY